MHCFPRGDIRRRPQSDKPNAREKGRPSERPRGRPSDLQRAISDQKSVTTIDCGDSTAILPSLVPEARWSGRPCVRPSVIITFTACITITIQQSQGGEPARRPHGCPVRHSPKTKLGQSVALACVAKTLGEASRSRFDPANATTQSTILMEAASLTTSRSSGRLF